MNLTEALLRSVRRRLALRSVTGVVLRLCGIGALLVLTLELTARVVVLDWLREAEAAGIALISSAATVFAARRAPTRRQALAVADRAAPEPGVFSAAAAAAPSRLLPLVQVRAEQFARDLMVRPPTLPAERLWLARAGVALLLGVGAAVLPGRLEHADAVTDGLRERLRNEAARLRQLPTDDPVERARVDRIADTLEARHLRASDVGAAADELREILRRTGADDRDAAEALKQTRLLGSAAAAALSGDAAGLKRAVADAIDRLRRGEVSKSDQTEVAAALIRLGARTADGARRSDALGAAQALGAGDGAGSASALERFVRTLRPVTAGSQTIEDIAVTVASAAEAAALGAGDGSPGSRGSRSVAPTVPALPGAAGNWPELADDDPHLRPGSADAVILRRYFAITPRR